jgi:RHS repeat-associated protein
VCEWLDLLGCWALISALPQVKTRLITFQLILCTASASPLFVGLGALAIVDNLPNSVDTQTCNYSYDDLARLGGVNANGHSVDCGTKWGQSFTYDPFGNITKQGSSTFAPTYSTTTNQFTVSGANVQYDGNGNLKTDNLSNTYTWDPNWGNPASVNGTNLIYDALGQMVEQQNGSTYTQMLYSQIGKTAIMNGQTLSKAFVTLPGGGTAIYKSTGLAYYRHADWLGSSRLTSTPARAVHSDSAYAPFGEEYAKSGTDDPSFTGQNADTNSTLYDFTFREYRPSQGRWVSPDPLGLGAANPGNPQSWNRYAYVLNNPLIAIDPLGLTCAAGEDGNWYDNGDGNGCGLAGQSVADNPINPDTVVNVNDTVEDVPTWDDNVYFFLLWASGIGPGTINYGPNDGMTQQLAGTSTFDQLRQKYKQQGCPNTGKPIPGGDHVTPFIEGYLPPGNSALAQVGGFSATGSTTGNVTTFTITNVAGQASFSGATTFGPTGAYILSVVGGAAFEPLNLPTVNGVRKNPYGANGSFHDITQKFTWTENNLCKQGG